MNLNKVYKWKISDLPSANNKVSKTIRKINNFSIQPWPFCKYAYILKRRLIKKVTTIKSFSFQHGFSMLFGNIYGDSVWFSNTYILDYAPIFFGKHITIGPDVKLITSWHDEENFNIVKAKSISIEDNVWITMNVIIMPGVTIGENSIIGAGSIVTKSIPPNSLVVGNPAKVIKKLNRDFKWWEELEVDQKLI